VKPAFVDCHSHVVPSGDDGASTIEDGIELCEDAAAHGTSVLYATPHVWPHLPLPEQREFEVRAAYEEMRERVSLDLRLGFELTPTRRLLREAPSRYVLEGTALGYHGESSEELGWQLIADGLIAIVASDGHRLSRPARLDGAYEAVRARVGDEAERMFDGSALSARPAPSRGAVRGA
jgi:tyrosine-protein phosphatase YwqE